MVLVSKRVRCGLYQSYVEHEDILVFFKGRLFAGQHIRHNLARPDHAYCRYTQQTCDIDDNQIIKWRLLETSFVINCFSVVHTNDSGNPVIACMPT